MVDWLGRMSEERLSDYTAAYKSGSMWDSEEKLYLAFMAERAKVEELEELYKTIAHTPIAKLGEENQQLKATIERIGELPEKWRDISRKTTEEYTNLHGCADELQAGLGKSDE